MNGVQLALNMSSIWFPPVDKCGDCDLEYKCICLNKYFHFICLSCGREYLKHHPPYQDNLVINYCIEYLDGTNIWFQDAKIHRVDGPAITGNVIKESWFLDHKHIIASSQEEFIKTQQYKKYKMKAFI